MTQRELEIFIKTRLTEAGDISQAEAAQMIGMDQTKFNRKLKKGPVNYLEAVALADALGYEIKWIKKRRGQQPGGGK